MFYKPQQRQELGGLLDSLLGIGTTVYQKYVDITAIKKAKAQAANDLKQLQEMQQLQEQARAQQAAIAASRPKVLGIDQNTLLIAGGVLAVGLLMKRR